MYWGTAVIQLPGWWFGDNADYDSIPGRLAGGLENGKWGMAHPQVRVAHPQVRVAHPQVRVRPQQPEEYRAGAGQ